MQQLLCHNRDDKLLSPCVDSSLPITPKQCQPVLLNGGTDVLLPVEVTLFPGGVQV